MSDDGSVEYLDLSPYDYRRFPLPTLAVGWLGHRYGIQSTGATPMTGAELEYFRAASQRLRSVTLGWHDCDSCPAFKGNGEYRYYVPGAPLLPGVLHLPGEPPTDRARGGRSHRPEIPPGT
jgi:hypothetical protein